MYLGPQHFQAQNRYFEDSIRFTTSSLWFAAYGLLGSEIDEDALKNGTLALLNARGIFPDGLAFYMPECDSLPAPRKIAELISPIRDSVNTYLAIPAWKADGQNCAIGESNGASPRYTAETRVVHDENTGRDQKQAQFGRKNIKILLDDEITDDQVLLPLARVKRGESGLLILDPRFVPPCLQITASPRIMMLLRRQIEILEDKSRTMSHQESKSSESFALSEVSKFWLLHAVNSNLVRLRHLYFSKRGHPEELYASMASLAGALCTFGLDSNPLTLPLYDHDHLEDCFEQLDQHIRVHLEIIIPTNALAIPLKSASDYFYTGAITDSRCLASGDWILSIQCPRDSAELIYQIPQLVKVCSNEFISKLVQRAMSGLSLTHLPMPPPAVRYSPDRQYFSVAKTGPCWDHIIQTRQVGVYVPGGIPQAGLELIAILPQ